jgi:hypothetical protein
LFFLSFAVAAVSVSVSVSSISSCACKIASKRNETQILIMSSLEICASISLQQIYVVEGEAEEEHHHHHFFYKKNEECLN